MKTRIFQFLLVVFLFPICVMAKDDLRSQQIIELYAKLEGKKYKTATTKAQIYDLAKVNYVKNAWNSDVVLEVYNQLLNGTDYSDQAKLKSVLLYEMEQYDKVNASTPIYKMDRKTFNATVQGILFKIYPELDPANMTEYDRELETQGAVRKSHQLSTEQIQERLVEKMAMMKSNGIDISKYELLSVQ